MKKNEALEITFSEITHELRTALIAITVAIGAVKTCLPTLIESYTLGKKNGLKFGEIPLEKLEMLEKLLENSEKEIYFVNDYMNMLTKRVTTQNFRNYSQNSIIANPTV